MQTAVKTAGLPSIKTIEAYNLTFHPKLNKKRVMALFDQDAIGRQENAIFLGHPPCRPEHFDIAAV